MTHARGTFEVTLTPHPADDVPVSRMTIDKQLHGDLEATSRGQMLAARGDVEGSAGYVAIERVTGTLHGRTGSFTLQHSGTMDRGAPSLRVTVVPDSGTGELVGLTGEMTIEAAGGQHSYGFAYRLPEAPGAVEQAGPPRQDAPETAAAPAVALDDLPALLRKLEKRGFRRDDVLLHDCAACGEHAVLTFVIASRIGGRDIQICQACGVATSFRSGVGQNERTADPDFDLRAFLA